MKKPHRQIEPRRTYVHGKTSSSPCSIYIYIPPGGPAFIRGGLRAGGLAILDAVLILLMRAQRGAPRKLLATDAAGVLHLLGVRVGLDLVADEIRHLIEALATQLALVRALVRVREDVVAQITCAEFIHSAGY